MDTHVVDAELSYGIGLSTGDEENGAYASRYYRAPAAASFAPVQRQDLELLRRLREMPLLSSPGAIDNVLTHAPELGISDAGRASSRTTRSCGWQTSSRACRIATVPTRRRIPSRSTGQHAGYLNEQEAWQALHEMTQEMMVNWLLWNGSPEPIH
jgi:hypothetical protein